MKRITPLFTATILLTTLSLLTGCSSGGGSSTPINNSTRSRDAKVAASQIQGVSSISDLSHISGLRSATLQKTSMAELLQWMSKKTGAAPTRLNQAPGFGYYSTTSTANGVVINFYQDSQGQQAAGSITVTYKQGSPTSYPFTFQATGSINTLSLSMDITYSTPDGNAFTVVGSISAPGASVSGIHLSLNLSDGTVSGSMNVTLNGTTVQYTNLSVNKNGTTSANFNIDGMNGQLTITSDGKGSLSLKDGAGTTSATWNSNGTGTITYPDGSSAAFSTNS